MVEVVDRREGDDLDEVALEFSSNGARRCESMRFECTLITPYLLGSRLANAPNDFGFESCFDQEVFLLDFFSYASIALVHNVRIAM